MKIPYQTIAVMFAILLVGTAYRSASFSWNTRLQGDVNLFALTARELVNHGRLFYPMKYEYSDQIDYLTLSHPATQHPPLFPVLAGALGWLMENDDAFFHLKSISFFVGFLLMVVIAVLGLRHGYYAATVLALLLISISPLMADYSANGSPYILSALMLLLSTYLISQFRYEALSHYASVAVLSAVGLLTHGAMVAVPAAFSLVWLFNLKRLRWTGVLLTAILGFLLLSPWMLWTYSHFGRPFYTYSSVALEMTWGFAAEGVVGDAISPRATAEIDRQFFIRYVPTVITSYLTFWLIQLIEIGPFAICLALVGGWSFWRTYKTHALQVLLPVFLYTLLPALTTVLRLRYLVPILPFTYMLTAWGFFSLYTRYRRVAIIGLIGTFVWLIPQYFELPPTRYYFSDAEFSKNYHEMKSLSLELREHDDGVVLGYAASLDGGVETVYWHRFPFVRGRYYDPSNQTNETVLLSKLAQDFGVRYIWADTATLPQLQKMFPEAQILLSNQRYYILERPQITNE